MRVPLRLVFLILGVTLASPVQAKPPTLERFSPPGVQRGKTIAVSAVGSFDHWPTQAVSDDKALEIKVETEKRKLSITAKAEARPGVHWIRLADDEGATSLRPFIVGDLPEINEIEASDEPVALESPRVTINGRLGRRNDVDEFSLPLKKGETLVAAVDANHHLGSPMDAVLQVVSTRNFVLAQNDDHQGFDPRIAYQVPEDGTYKVRIFAFPATPNSTIAFSGGDNYVYRLTITTGPYFDHGFPMAVSRQDPKPVEAHGWNLPPEGRPLEVGTTEERDVVTLSHPDIANVVEIPVIAHPSLTEQTSSDPKFRQPLPVPSTVTGRIDQPGDDDLYEFTAKKGQTLRIRVEARKLGTPLDPFIRLTDSKGAVVNEVDDQGRDERDPQLSLTPPSDGTYQVMIRDLHREGGMDYVYRLSIETLEPDYQLTLKSDRVNLTPGKPGKVEVAIDRKNGFKGTIEVALAGEAEGVSAPPVKSEQGKPSAKTVTLTVTATDKAKSGTLQVVGKVAESPTLVRRAHAPIEGFSGVTTDQGWISILKATPAK